MTLQPYQEVKSDNNSYIQLTVTLLSPDSHSMELSFAHSWLPTLTKPIWKLPHGHAKVYLPGDFR